MNKRRKQQRSLSPRPIRAIAFSTLAAALVLAPVVMDVETGSLGWSSAFAKSCFRAGTRVRMADGSEKAIELVKVGDQVLGNNGSINRVREVEKVPLAERLLYRINGGRAFVTEEHPFMSTAGWRSISPAATFRENAHLRVAPMRVGDSLLMFAGYRELPGIGVGATARQIAWEPAFEPVRVRAIDAVEADPHESVYNLLLDGDNTYIADGYLVHNKGGGSGGSGSG
ncbi:MAG: hypothetical protein KDI63_17210, partial [Gammaproteobacteria bacterium]|nr:hypothetical protein [Gammaproteobacteria bacterium]